MNGCVAVGAFITKPCPVSCDCSSVAKRTLLERTMNTTMFVVRSFHQGRTLRPQHFGNESQALHCADSMKGAIDCVVLAVTTSKSIALRRASPQPAAA
jgi:hypothetical protein